MHMPPGGALMNHAAEISGKQVSNEKENTRGGLACSKQASPGWSLTSRSEHPEDSARQPERDKLRVAGCVRTAWWRTANLRVAGPGQARCHSVNLERVKTDALDRSGTGEAAHMPDSSWARLLIRT